MRSCLLSARPLTFRKQKNIVVVRVPVAACLTDECAAYFMRYTKRKMTYNHRFFMNECDLWDLICSLPHRIYEWNELELPVLRSWMPWLMCEVCLRVVYLQFKKRYDLLRIFSVRFIHAFCFMCIHVACMTMRAFYLDSIVFDCIMSRWEIQNARQHVFALFDFPLGTKLLVFSPLLHYFLHCILSPGNFKRSQTKKHRLQNIILCDGKQPAEPT